MKKDMVLFEGIVMDAYETNISDIPGEVIYVNYPLEPINVINITYNEKTRQVEENFAGVNDTGWIQIRLPVFNGLKSGDKIKVIKCS